MKKIFIIMSLLLVMILYVIYRITNADPIASWHLVNVNYGKLQGDANIITIKDKVIMIDAGYYAEANTALIPYLREKNITRVDYFFVSHPHRDHYEGLAAILDAGIQVDNLYFRVPPKDICDRERPWGCNYDHVLGYINGARSKGITVHNPTTGFKLDLPYNSKIEVLHVQEGDLPNVKIDANDLSLVMKWTIKDFDVLFTGDLNKNLGTHLTSDNRMKSRFMKMPHHGGRSIAPNSFFDTVAPEYVLVPGPKWVWCGERGNQPRNWVYKTGLPHWVNGIHGNIRVDFSNNGGGEIHREKNGFCSSEDTRASLPNPYIF